MKNFLLLPVLCLLSTMIQAQSLTLKVWSGSIPGAKTSADYKEVTLYDNGRPRVSKVTDPELIVYLPTKDKANGTAVVICPGGGYGRLAIDHEGYAVAQWLNTLGIAGIILKYRLPSDVIMNDKTIGPLQDVQEAIRVVKRKSSEWGLKPGRIGVLGFSAGGHLAGTASTLYNKNVYQPADTTSARPDFSILIYGVLSMQGSFTHGGSLSNLLGTNPTQELMDSFSNELQITAETPPAFLVHAADDGAVPVQNSILYFQALKKNNIPAELHIYEKGGHGFGLAPNRSTESNWPEACEKWMKAHGWLGN